jgi:putative oxidoreductase
LSDADVVVVLLVRVVLGAIMIAHGVNHWRGGGRIEGTARWFGGLGLRHGTLQAWLSVLTEVGAGVLVVAGLLTSLACAAVISVMLVAGLLAHRPNGFFVFKDGYEYVLTLAVVALALAVLGPGRLSLDHASDIEVTGWAGGGIALGVAVGATAGLLAVFWRPRPTTDTPQPTTDTPDGAPDTPDGAPEAADSDDPPATEPAEQEAR